MNLESHEAPAETVRELDADRNFDSAKDTRTQPERVADALDDSQMDEKHRPA